MIEIIISFLIPILIYLLGNKKERVTRPFASGFKIKKSRLKYRDPWFIFAFLFVIFEEFLVIIAFLSPESIEMIVFYLLITASALAVIR